MKKIILQIFFTITLVLFFNPNHDLLAQSPCAKSSIDLFQEKILATASTFSNLRKTPESIRAQTERLLNQAINRLPSIQPSQELCSEPCCMVCAKKNPPQIKFSSVPNKFLSNYSQSEKCAALLKQTQVNPFSYKQRHFASIEEFAEWFGQLSSGKGSDGVDLYKRCDGSCSPQYFVQLSKEPNGLTVNADVLCGHARDKDDNQYLLSQAFTWQCG